MSRPHRQFSRSQSPRKRATASRVTGIVRDTIADGRGVTITDQGQIVFVPGVWPGEEVVIDMMTPTRGPATGTLVDIVRPSASRVAPSCHYHEQGNCGGCPWAFVDYDAQVVQKLARVRSSSHRLGYCEDIEILRAPDNKRYRNRAQFKSNGVDIGYVAAKSHRIVDVEFCEVLSAGAAEQLHRLRTKLPNPDWSTRRGWTTIDIDDLADEPLVNQRQAFRQANTEQNLELKRWLSQRLTALPPVEKCVELFCGGGNLTEVLSQTLDSLIVAVDGQGGAIENLMRINLPSVSAFAVDLFDSASFQDLLNRVGSFGGLVLDPPRDGLKCAAPLLDRIDDTSWIVYIACDLATWERDIALFQDRGLVLDHVTLLDMFPQTPHVEILSVCRRQSN